MIKKIQEKTFNQSKGQNHFYLLFHRNIFIKPMRSHPERDNRFDEGLDLLIID